MRILIELPTWIGDSIMATPAIENIIKLFEPKPSKLLMSADKMSKINEPGSKYRLAM